MVLRALQKLMRWVVRQWRTWMDLRRGTYIVGRRLGQGGMGTVYEAKHRHLARKVALKVVRPGKHPSDLQARFAREADVASRLDHPNVVTFHEHGVMPDGRGYVAMELVDGLSLAEVIALAAPLSSQRALHILEQLAAGLAHTHARGVIHRDLKPSNVMVEQREGYPDLVKLLDFGLATTTEDDDDDGKLVGTPLFMAPEVIEGRPATKETDVYAFGTIAYALLTGEHLFEEQESERSRLLRAHLTQPPVPPSLRRRDGLDPELDALVMRCLEKDPSRRFADGGDLLIALRAFRGGQLRPVDGFELRAPTTVRRPGSTCVDPSSWPLELRRPSRHTSSTIAHNRFAPSSRLRPMLDA